MTLPIFLYTVFVMGGVLGTSPHLNAGVMTRSRFFMLMQIFFLAWLCLVYSMYLTQSDPVHLWNIAVWAVSILILGAAFGTTVLARSKGAGFGFRWAAASILMPLLAVRLFLRIGPPRPAWLDKSKSITHGTYLGAGLIALSISGAVANKAAIFYMIDSFASSVNAAGGSAESHGNHLILTVPAIQREALGGSLIVEGEAKSLCLDPSAVPLLAIGAEIVIRWDGSGDEEYTKISNEICQNLLSSSLING